LLLEEDGLDELWDKEVPSYWEGEAGNHEDQDMECILTQQSFTSKPV
jgi:hypothetical protein